MRRVYVSALTFADLVYVMRKQLEPEMIEDVLKKLSLIFRFTDLTVTDMTAAAAMRWNDFEDALQSVAAERLNADFIITRNVRDFRKSKVTALTPTEFIARL